MKQKLLLSLFALLTAMTARADVTVNATNFPDEGFRNWIKSQPYGADSLLTDAEIAGVTELKLYSNYFHSLKGIEFFTALTTLRCQGNQLTALMAYYAYLIIGIDLDTFSPLGGTDVLQRCMYLVNNAQDLGYPGWKSFEDSRNRFAIINDYLDEPFKPFRQLQYDYYRKGLDEMANNVERGRTEVTTALQNGLKAAHEAKPLSLVPQIWTDYKKEELANIYKGKGTQKEKEAVYDILFSINASQNNTWEKIKQ